VQDTRLLVLLWHSSHTWGKHLGCNGKRQRSTCLQKTTVSLFTLCYALNLNQHINTLSKYSMYQIQFWYQQFSLLFQTKPLFLSYLWILPTAQNTNTVPTACQRMHQFRNIRRVNLIQHKFFGRNQEERRIPSINQRREITTLLLNMIPRKYLALLHKKAHHPLVTLLNIFIVVVT
jgi:hypothetical protein